MAVPQLINFKIQIQVVFFFISRDPFLRARLFSTFTQTAVTTVRQPLRRYNPACLQPPAVQSTTPACIALRTDQRRSYRTTKEPTMMEGMTRSGSAAAKGIALQ